MDFWSISRLLSFKNFSEFQAPIALINKIKLIRGSEDSTRSRKFKNTYPA